MLGATILCSTTSILATQAAEDVPHIVLPRQSVWDPPEIMFANVLPFAALEDADIAVLDAPVQMLNPSDKGGAVPRQDDQATLRPRPTAVPKKVARDAAAERFALNKHLERHLSVEDIRKLRERLRRQDAPKFNKNDAPGLGMELRALARTAVRTMDASLLESQWLKDASVTSSHRLAVTSESVSRGPSTSEASPPASQGLGDEPEALGEDSPVSELPTTAGAAGPAEGDDPGARRWRIAWN
jgi:hypothetical protein